MKAFRRVVLVGALSAMVLLLFSGCNFMYGLFDPLLGTWALSSSTSTSGVTTTHTEDFTFNYDNTWTLSATDSGPVIETMSGSGTYTQDSSTKSVTIVGSMTTATTSPSSSTYTSSLDQTYSYSISGSQLTFTSSSGGQPATFTRK